MCRNIRPLFNLQPPATEQEIREASLQFVRKLSGFSHPSRANQTSFTRAVNEVASAARVLLDSLSTTAHPRNRQATRALRKERVRDPGAADSSSAAPR
jgi:hypothetical protein